MTPAALTALLGHVRRAPKRAGAEGGPFRLNRPGFGPAGLRRGDGCFT